MQNLKQIKSLDTMKLLSDEEIHMIVRAIDHDILFTALSTEACEITDRVLSVMSLKSIRNVISSILNKDKLENKNILVCQKELLILINDLVSDGSIYFLKDKPKKANSEKQLDNLSVLNWNNNDELIEAFYFLALESRKNSILGLEKYINEIDEPIVKKLLEFIVDGFEMDYLNTYIANIKRSRIENENRRLDIIKTGVFAIMSGLNPNVLKELMSPLSVVGGPDTTIKSEIR